MNNTTTSTTPTLMAIDQPGCRINSDTPHLRLRHGYAADSHHDLPDPAHATVPTVPHPHGRLADDYEGAGTHRTPAQIHRVRAGRR